MNGNYLKGKMAERGYTQDRLAKEIGVSAQTIGRKVSGERQFTVREANAIASVLQLTPAQAVDIFLPSASQICNGGGGNV